MDDKKGIGLVLLLIAGFVMFFGMYLGWRITNSDVRALQSECVNRGHATFTVDKFHNVTFEWKDNP